MEQFSSLALVLAKKDLADGSRSVLFLTKRRGLLRAVVFGACRSKGGKSALSAPFCLIDAIFSSKGQTGFALQEAAELERYDCFSDDLEAFFRACLWSEALEKSFGGGGDGRFFSLYLFLLRALNARESAYAVLDFLFYYYFLYLNGSALPMVLQPEEQAVLAGGLEAALSRNWPDERLKILNARLLAGFQTLFNPPLKSFKAAKAFL